ncbi:MAG TPA: formyltetrahydrofolate deformylase [Rhizomicrobium sp.]|nr:formyltetrahydrofolate deformylase [Rhizomicrobium sp.]
MSNPRGVLTLACPDRKGIVASVSRFLYENGCNIIDSSQFGDRRNGQFFLRTYFESESGKQIPNLEELFSPVARDFDMEWHFYDSAKKPRALIMVSRFGHCLVDLLYRIRIGALPIEVPVVVSNHRDLADVVAASGIPFRYLPVTPDNKPEQEEALSEIVETKRIDLVVLARYMQILSSNLTNRWPGRVINIHHSFLPSFKGAKPYHQAYERGVKLIGATAHYVTEDLDEGPIIEQEVERVNHAMSPEECAAVGRDIESRVLARAVKWHAEHRVLLNGTRTVVFT